MSNVREHILQTTCDLMEKQGYHGTGLTEVVKQAALQKGRCIIIFLKARSKLHLKRFCNQAKRLPSGYKTD